MNGKEMLESLNYVDEKYIEDAEAAPKRRRVRWQPLAAAAACLVLVLAAGAWRLTVTKEAAPETAAQMEEAAVYSGSTADVPMVMAAKGAHAPEMTVTVLEQAAANDAGETADTAGVILRCTVDDPGDSGFAPGQEITVLLPASGQEITVLLPASGEALPVHLRIAYVMEEAENTVTAVTWAEAETDEK